MTTSKRASALVSPLSLYRVVARTEAVTWTLLLIGMFLKYVTHTTDLGVRVAGMLHGIAFVTFAVVTVALWVDNKWSLGRGLAGLVSAIPPFATLFFDSRAEKDGIISRSWRLAPEVHVGAGSGIGTGNRARAQALSLPEKALAWVLRNPKLGALASGCLIAVLVAAFLLIGPPMSKG